VVVEVHALPQQRLERGGLLWRDVGGHGEEVDRQPLVPPQRQADGAAAGRHRLLRDLDQILVGDGRPQRHPHRQVRAVDRFVWRLEADHDVRAPPLRPDERGRVGLAALQLGRDLGRRVATLGAVALDLPPAPQVLGRVQVDADGERAAHLPGVQREQALHHHELACDHVLGHAEGAVAVLVDRLQDRLPGGQQAQVLRQDIHVVAGRVERGDVQFLALDAVVAVVVVGADGCHPVNAEQLHDSGGEGRLAGGAVPDGREHDRLHEHTGSPGAFPMSGSIRTPSSGRR
jgi:hypothetical protein